MQGFGSPHHHFFTVAQGAIDLDPIAIGHTGGHRYPLGLTVEHRENRNAVGADDDGVARQRQCLVG